jgi:hypothetical protein
MSTPLPDHPLSRSRTFTGQPQHRAHTHAELASDPADAGPLDEARRGSNRSLPRAKHIAQLDDLDDLGRKNLIAVFPKNPHRYWNLDDLDDGFLDPLAKHYPTRARGKDKHG